MIAEEEEYKNRILKRVKEVESGGFEPSDMGRTVNIVRRYSDSMQDNNETRLLYEKGAGGDLSFEDLNDPSKYFRVENRGKLVLGRSKDRCDLAISHDDSVSARHCELEMRDGNCFVRDLGSSNGTFVNNEKVYTESILQDGDILKMGSLSLLVRFS